MKLVLPLLCAAAALVLATAAEAQPGAPAPVEAAPQPDPETDALPEGAPLADTPAPAPPAPEAPPAIPTVKVRAPDMATGVKRRYRITSRAEVSRGGQTQARTNEQLVELEVVDARAGKPVLRYVIVEGSVADDPIGAALLTASKGVATDFEADPSGKPVRLTEWEKVRATILERLLLDPSAPLEGAKRTRAVLTAMDSVAAVAFAVPEMGMMADMQAWPEIAVGQVAEAARTTRFGEHEARLVSRREATPPAGRSG